MSEENSSMSNMNTQTTMNQKTGALLSLSNHNSKEESGDSIIKSFDNSSMLKAEKTKSDNRVEQEVVSKIEISSQKA